MDAFRLNWVTFALNYIKCFLSTQRSVFYEENSWLLYQYTLKSTMCILLYANLVCMLWWLFDSLKTAILLNFFLNFSQIKNKRLCYTTYIVTTTASAILALANENKSIRIRHFEKKNWKWCISFFFTMMVICYEWVIFSIVLSYRLKLW